MKSTISDPFKSGGTKEQKGQPFEKQQHDLTGLASVDFHESAGLNQLANHLNRGFDPNRFELVALRVFVQKDHPVVTLFALDKFKQEQSGFPKDKLPVKKFKLTLSWDVFFKYVKRFDFTVSDQAFDIEDMLVTNK